MSPGAVPVTPAVRLFIPVVKLRVALGPCSAFVGLLSGCGHLRLALYLVVHCMDQYFRVGHCQHPNFVEGEFPPDKMVEDVNAIDFQYELVVDTQSDQRVLQDKKYRL